MDAKLWKSIGRKLWKPDVDGAIETLEALLAKAKGDRFKGLIGAGFSNSPRAVLSAINKFIRGCQESFDIQAIYLEMNGFDINYDRWYFDSFGYREYGSDPKDLDWLSDWQSEIPPQVTLKGLEAVQKDFERTNVEEVFDKAYELATLLVMTRFVCLIQAALQSGKLAKPIPVLATAHDFDIVGRFE